MWVTREGVYVDRIASAWLIRRFIDPEARFKFVTPKGYRPQPGEVRFDMFEAEYTHEGEACTFEILTKRFGLTDSALRAIGEIVHDIDYKEPRFGRPETAGVERLLTGIARPHAREIRVNRAATAWLIHRFIDRDAISQGFPLVARDALDTVERASFLYDALYAFLQQRGP